MFALLMNVDIININILIIGLGIYQLTVGIIMPQTPCIGFL